jgi:probable HAF family extracellular repeat protein
MKTTHFTSALLAGLVVFAAQNAPSAVKYTVTDLGALGTTSSYAFGMSSNGLVTGNYGNGSNKAFLYANGTMSDLGTVAGGTTSYGYGVNNSGQVVGYASVAGSDRAFLYTNGTMTNLGANGGTSSQARGINDAGQVAGFLVTGGKYRAFLYQNGMMTEIAPLTGNQCQALAINNSGVIAGWTSIDAGSGQHAATYANGAWTDIGSLGGNSYASAINSKGHVVGRSGFASGMEIRGFLYKDGTMVDLGSLAGSLNNSFAAAINDADQVVGYSGNSAFLYENGVMTDLNTLIPANSGFMNLEYANAIDNSGRIAGYGTTTDSHIHAFLLTPIPVPPAAAPTLAVSGKKKLSTTRVKIVVRGVTSGEVTNVTYKLGKRTRTATGASAWKFTARLNPGRNVLTIVAHGPGGNSAPAKVIVIRK